METGAEEILQVSWVADDMFHGMMRIHLVNFVMNREANLASPDAEVNRTDHRSFQILEVDFDADDTVAPDS